MKVELCFRAHGAWLSDNLHVTIEGPAWVVNLVMADVRKNIKEVPVYEDYEET